MKVDTGSKFSGFIGCKNFLNRPYDIVEDFYSLPDEVLIVLVIYASADYGMGIVRGG